MNELQGGQFHDAAPGQLRVVAPVEAFQILGLGQTAQRIAPVEQARVAPVQFVLHQPGEGLDEVHLVAGHGQGSRLQSVAHARQTQTKVATTDDYHFR